jgi:hypothetical protein
MRIFIAVVLVSVGAQAVEAGWLFGPTVVTRVRVNHYYGIAPSSAVGYAVPPTVYYVAPSQSLQDYVSAPAASYSSVEAYEAPVAAVKVRPKRAARHSAKAVYHQKMAQYYGDP